VSGPGTTLWDCQPVTAVVGSHLCVLAGLIPDERTSHTTENPLFGPGVEQEDTSASCGLPAVPAPRPARCTAANCEADEPEDEDDNGQDPQEVHREPEPSEKERQQEYDQDESHGVSLSSIRQG